MFRPLLTISVIALTTPAHADTIIGLARVDTVTIYPGQATVARDISLGLPAGRHEIVVPGLPENLDPQGLRLVAPDGVQIGAVNLARGRLPVTPDQDRPAVVAARADVVRLEQVLRDREAAIAEIRLRVQAANEQITFLQSLSQASAGETLTGSTIADIQALAQMVGTETLRVRQAAFAAEQEAKAAERAREDDVQALEEAKQALAALLSPETDGSVLTFTVETATARDVTVTASAIEGFATWSPIYDMRLTTGENAALTLERSVVVSQSTGQDWRDVKLVLSTARPGEQTAPSEVYSYPRRIVPEDELERPRPLADSSGALRSNVAPAPTQLAEAAPFKAIADFSGANVTYSYPGTVTIRNGVEDLRLPLDTLEFDARVWAEAAPSRDNIAYRVAAFTNTTAEVLLPGQALLYADGTMIGFDQLPLLAAGADVQIGFGPLDGIRLTRAIPGRSEGETGVFSRANEFRETVLIGVDNLTGQDWDVLLRDAVPYTEQDDLELTVTATPPVTRMDPDGRRGILEWDLSVPTQTRQEVRLDYTLKWPDGYVLR
ncbi:DUF4139 domain-containing protein [Yoonia sp.]|uniref:DUF4139 domain-containing protein n=1 Tax=Yoonia sp. TaxID=2212373 RepID=UPI003F6AA07B